jgi:hypothetical protein
LRIRTVTAEQFKQDGKTENKIALWFSGKGGVEIEQGLICNKTRLRLLQSVFGDDTDNWKDKVVTLVPVQERFGNKLVPSIGIKFDIPENANVTSGPEIIKGGVPGAGQVEASQSDSIEFEPDGGTDDFGQPNVSDDLDDELPGDLKKAG